jgi:hypothetical protein
VQDGFVQRDEFAGFEIAGWVVGITGNQIIIEPNTQGLQDVHA